MVRGPNWVERPVLWFSLILIGSIFLDVATVLVMRPGLRVDQLEVDEYEYYDLGGQIADGTYQFNPRRVIGHPLLIAALRGTLGNRPLHIQLVVTALYSLTAPLAYLLARRELQDDRAALLGGLGVMLWPLFVWYGASLYSETVALPLFTALLLAMPRTSPTHPHKARWFGAGMVLGLCMHYRPMYLLYGPLGAVVAYSRGPGGRSGLVRAALLAAGCLVLILPWSVLMTVRTGSPVLLSSNGGETIAGGLNPELLRLAREPEVPMFITPMGRATWVGPGKWLRPGRTGYLSQEEKQLPYTQMSQLLSQRTIAWVRANPSAAAYLSIRKLLYMWGIYPFWNGRSQTLLGNVPTMMLLALALAAIVRLRACLRALAIFWTLPIFVSLVALISWGSWRFRQPGDLGLILLAAALPFAADVRAAIAGSDKATPDDSPLGVVMSESGSQLP